MKAWYYKTTFTVEHMCDWKRKYNLAFKSVSVVLIFAFIVYDITWAQAGTPAFANNNQSDHVGAHCNVPLRDISIPGNTGKVTYAHTVASGKETIINIQDAHASLSAQYNIADMLDELNAKYDMSLVALEGSEGAIDMSVLKSFPDANAKKDAADYLMRQGRMSAGEYFSALSSKDIKAYGIEDDKLYQANLEAFKAIMDKSSEACASMDKLQAAMEFYGNAVYSHELKALLDVIKAHKDAKTGFSSYWKTISREVKSRNIPVDAYSNLSILLKTTQMEESIDFPSANNERKAIIAALSEAMAKPELEKLVRQSADFKLGKMGQAAYHNSLLEMAAKYGMNTDEYKNLLKFSAYINAYESIDITGLYEEIDIIEQAVLEGMFKNNDERALYGMERDIRLINKMYRVNLTPAEYKRLAGRDTDSIKGGLKAFLKQAPVKYNMAIQDPGDVDVIFDNLAPAMDFYRIAEERNQKMLANTLSAMRASGQKIAAMVTGGFHTSGITALMGAENVSYLVIMPNMAPDGTGDRERPYITVLTNKTQPYEKLIEEGKYTLAVRSYHYTSDIHDILPEIKVLLASSEQGNVDWDKRRSFLKAFKAAQAAYAGQTTVKRPVTPEQLAGLLGLDLNGNMLDTGAKNGIYTEKVSLGEDDIIVVREYERGKLANELAYLKGADGEYHLDIVPAGAKKILDKRENITSIKQAWRGISTASRLALTVRLNKYFNSTRDLTTGERDIIGILDRTIEALGDHDQAKRALDNEVISAFVKKARASGYDITAKDSAKSPALSNLLRAAVNKRILEQKGEGMAPAGSVSGNAPGSVQPASHDTGKVPVTAGISGHTGAHRHGFIAPGVFALLSLPAIGVMAVNAGPVITTLFIAGFSAVCAVTLTLAFFAFAVPKLIDRSCKLSKISPESSYAVWAHRGKINVLDNAFEHVSPWLRQVIIFLNKVIYRSGKVKTWHFDKVTNPAGMQPFEQRHIVIGDWHAQRPQKLEEMLYASKYLDEKGSIIARNTTLVISGDEMDRGKSSTKAVDLISSLQGQLQSPQNETGCKILRLIGNHEFMLHRGIVDRDDMQLLDWLVNKAADGNQKAVELCKKISPSGISLSQARKEIASKPEYKDWRDLCRKIHVNITNGMYRAAYAYNGILFVHGGISKKTLDKMSALSGISPDMDAQTAANMINSYFEEYAAKAAGSKVTSDSYDKKMQALHSALWDHYEEEVTGDGVPFAQSVAHSVVPEISYISENDGLKVLNTNIDQRYGRLGYVEMNGPVIRAYRSTPDLPMWYIRVLKYRRVLQRNRDLMAIGRLHVDTVKGLQTAFEDMARHAPRTFDLQSMREGLNAFVASFADEKIKAMSDMAGQARASRRNVNASIFNRLMDDLIEMSQAGLLTLEKTKQALDMATELRGEIIMAIGVISRDTDSRLEKLRAELKESEEGNVVNLEVLNGAQDETNESAKTTVLAAMNTAALILAIFAVTLVIVYVVYSFIIQLMNSGRLVIPVQGKGALSVLSFMAMAVLGSVVQNGGEDENQGQGTDADEAGDKLEPFSLGDIATEAPVGWIRSFGNMIHNLFTFNPYPGSHKHYVKNMIAMTALSNSEDFNTSITDDGNVVVATRDRGGDIDKRLSEIIQDATKSRFTQRYAFKQVITDYNGRRIKVAVACFKPEANLSEDDSAKLADKAVQRLDSDTNFRGKSSIPNWTTGGLFGELQTNKEVYNMPQAEDITSVPEGLSAVHTLDTRMGCAYAKMQYMIGELGGVSSLQTPGMPAIMTIIARVCKQAHLDDLAKYRKLAGLLKDEIAKREQAIKAYAEEFTRTQHNTILQMKNNAELEREKFYEFWYYLNNIRGNFHEEAYDVKQATPLGMVTPNMPMILFVDVVTPAEIDFLVKRYNIKALVTKDATMTSHWVITAKNKGIPVVILEEPKNWTLEFSKCVAPQHEEANRRMVLVRSDSANNAEIVIGPSLVTCESFLDTLLKETAIEKIAYDDIKKSESPTRVPVGDMGFDINLYINAESASAISESSDVNRTEGVGLVRTEYLFMGQENDNSVEPKLINEYLEWLATYWTMPNDHAKERMRVRTAGILNDHRNAIRDKMKADFIAMNGAAAGDKPVTVRTIDFTSDKETIIHKFINTDAGFKAAHAAKCAELGIPDEIGSGVEFYYSPIGEELLTLELEAIIEAYIDGADKLRVLFPMVSNSEHVQRLMARSNSVLGAARENVMARLASQGKVEGYEAIAELRKKLSSLPVGVMIETVEACENIDDILAYDEISFISVGTNDLSRIVMSYAKYSDEHSGRYPEKESDVALLSRDNPKNSLLLDVLQPAVLERITRLLLSVAAFNKENPGKKKSISFCGEMASWYEFHVFVAHKMEKIIRYMKLDPKDLPVGLSMSGSRVPLVRAFLHALSRAHYDGIQSFLQQAEDEFGKVNVNEKTDIVVQRVFYSLFNNADGHEKTGRQIYKQLARELRRSSLEGLNHPDSSNVIRYTLEMLRRRSGAVNQLPTDMDAENIAPESKMIPVEKLEKEAGRVITKARSIKLTDHSASPGVTRRFFLAGERGLHARPLNDIAAMAAQYDVELRLKGVKIPMMQPLGCDRLIDTSSTTVAIADLGVPREEIVEVELEVKGDRAEEFLNDLTDDLKGIKDTLYDDTPCMFLKPYIPESGLGSLTALGNRLVPEWSPFIHAPVLEEAVKLGVPLILLKALNTVWPEMVIVNIVLSAWMLVSLGYIYRIAHILNGMDPPFDENDKLYVKLLKMRGAYRELPRDEKVRIFFAPVIAEISGYFAYIAYVVETMFNPEFAAHFGPTSDWLMMGGVMTFAIFGHMLLNLMIDDYNRLYGYGFATVNPQQYDAKKDARVICYGYALRLYAMIEPGTGTKEQVTMLMRELNQALGRKDMFLKSEIFESAKEYIDGNIKTGVELLEKLIARENYSFARQVSRDSRRHGMPEIETPGFSNKKPFVMRGDSGYIVGSYPILWRAMESTARVIENEMDSYRNISLVRQQLDRLVNIIPKPGAQMQLFNDGITSMLPVLDNYRDRLLGSRSVGRALIGQQLNCITGIIRAGHMNTLSLPVKMAIEICMAQEKSCITTATDRLQNNMKAVLDMMRDRNTQLFKMAFSINRNLEGMRPIDLRDESGTFMYGQFDLARFREAQTLSLQTAAKAIGASFWMREPEMTRVRQAAYGISSVLDDLPKSQAKSSLRRQAHKYASYIMRKANQGVYLVDFMELYYAELFKTLHSAAYSLDAARNHAFDVAFTRFLRSHNISAQEEKAHRYYSICFQAVYIPTKGKGKDSSLGISNNVFMASLDLVRLVEAKSMGYFYGKQQFRVKTNALVDRISQKRFFDLDENEKSNIVMAIARDHELNVEESEVLMKMARLETPKAAVPELGSKYAWTGMVLGAAVIAPSLAWSDGLLGIGVSVMVSMAVFIPGYFIHEMGHIIAKDRRLENVKEMRAGPMASAWLFAITFCAALAFAILPSVDIPYAQIPVSIILMSASANYAAHIFADHGALFEWRTLLIPEKPAVKQVRPPAKEDTHRVLSPLEIKMKEIGDETRRLRSELDKVEQGFADLSGSLGKNPWTKMSDLEKVELINQHYNEHKPRAGKPRSMAPVSEMTEALRWLVDIAESKYESVLVRAHARNIYAQLRNLSQMKAEKTGYAVSDMGGFWEAHVFAAPYRHTVGHESQLSACQQQFGQILDEMSKRFNIGRNDIKVLKRGVFVKAGDNREFETAVSVMKPKLDGPKDIPTSFIGELPDNYYDTAVEYTVLIPKSADTEVIYRNIGADIRQGEKTAHYSLRYAVIHSQGMKWVTAAGLTSGPEFSDMREQSDIGFKLMRKILDAENMRMSDIARQWNFMERIVDMEKDGDDMRQRYQVFNDVRGMHYYDDCGGFDRMGYPAATGIGTSNGGVVLEFVAVKSERAGGAVVPLRNPLQVDAHRYTSEVLEKGIDPKQQFTPKFERAKAVVSSGIARIYVSGTAGIRGQATVKPTSVDEQTRVTLENIAALIGKKNLSDHGINASASLSDITQARVYVKNTRDIVTVQRVCKELMPDAAVQYVTADVCRTNLLVEIEAIATVPGIMTDNMLIGVIGKSEAVRPAIDAIKDKLWGVRFEIVDETLSEDEAMSALTKQANGAGILDIGLTKFVSQESFSAQMRDLIANMDRGLLSKYRQTPKEVPLTDGNLEAIKGELSTIANSIGAIRPKFAGELSVYQYKWERLAHEYAVMPKAYDEVYAQYGQLKDPKYFVVRAESAADLHGLVAEHLKGMGTRNGKLVIKVSSELKARMANGGDVTAETVYRLLEQMGFDSRVLVGNGITVTLDDTASLAETLSNVRTLYGKENITMKDIAIGDSRKPAAGSDIPDGFIYVVRETEGFASQTYQLMVSLSYNSGLGAESLMNIESLKRVWEPNGQFFYFTFRPAKPVNYEDLKRELARYEQVLLAA